MPKSSQKSLDDTMQSRRLRSACDICHQAKTRCSGGTPCTGCQNSGYKCVYSISNRLGRPKGTTKNNTQRHRAANNTPSAPTMNASTIFATSAFYKNLSPFDDNMLVDPPSEISSDVSFVPSAEAFWELMNHETISSSGSSSGFFLKENDSNAQTKVLIALIDIHFRSTDTCH